MMRNQLINRLSINDIYSLCLQTQGKENNCLKEELYQLTLDENNRVAFNALWALSHFDEANNPWLFQKHDDLIDRVLVEKNETKRRLMLSLLLRQPFEEESLRSDFIDFCIAKITACSQPYAIRCYCMKLAYEQMKYYPELLTELKAAIEGMPWGYLFFHNKTVRAFEKEMKDRNDQNNSAIPCFIIYSSFASSEVKGVKGVIAPYGR